MTNRLIRLSEVGGIETLFFRMVCKLVSPISTHRCVEHVVRDLIDVEGTDQPIGDKTKPSKKLREVPDIG